MVINMFHTRRLNYVRNLININQLSFSFPLLFSFTASRKETNTQPFVFIDYF
ncbi:hypothetical protein BN4901_0270 [Citrobacter europaeus]|uniref:PheST operon leader peptide PheM n=1 Tax=Citrobacter europaeus TaxID=1914243 RepID=A0ABY0JL44_9ENTR|nr:hypothetical protein BN4901_0270 [Citrobacter europaeus]